MLQPSESQNWKFLGTFRLSPIVVLTSTANTLSTDSEIANAKKQSPEPISKNEVDGFNSLFNSFNLCVIALFCWAGDAFLVS